MALPFILKKPTIPKIQKRNSKVRFRKLLPPNFCYVRKLREEKSFLPWAFFCLEIFQSFFFLSFPFQTFARYKLLANEIKALQRIAVQRLEMENRRRLHYFPVQNVYAGLFVQDGGNWCQHLPSHLFILSETFSFQL